MLINLLLSLGDFFAAVCRVCPRPFAFEGELLHSGVPCTLHDAPALELLYCEDLLALLSGLSLYFDATGTDNKVSLYYWISTVYSVLPFAINFYSVCVAFKNYANLQA